MGYKNFERILHLYGEISQPIISGIHKDLINLLSEDEDRDEKEKDFIREPIKIFINSLGGNVCDMFALISLMISSKTPIYTYCTGYAYSAACTLFLAGHKRFCYDYSEFMIHSLSSCSFGKFKDILEQKEYCEALQDKIDTFILKRTQILKDSLQEIHNKKRDWYLTPQAALDLGLVHSVILKN